MNKTKFELVEETEVDGQVWYKIHKDGQYVLGTLTKRLDEANRMFGEFSNGRQTVPILKVIKTIEVNETHKTD